MATNNINSNYFSVAAYTNKGISGMISGLDTENMVKQMLAGTQKKIDRQLALRQQAIWKQQIYRDIINSINNVRNKYFNTAFDASPLNNLSNGKFFNSKISSVTAGSAVKILNTAAGADIGELRVAVLDLASAASLTSLKSVGAGDRLTAGKALDDAMLKGFDKTLHLSVGGNHAYIDMNGVSTQEAMVNKINEALYAAGTDAIASVYDGKLRIVSEQGDLVNVGAQTTNMASRMTGLAAGQASGALTPGVGRILQAGAQINPGAGVTFTVNLDGIEKQITLNPLTDPAYDPGVPGSMKITADTLKDSLQLELNKAFGNYINVAVNGDDQIELLLNFGGETGHSVTVFGSDASKLGFSPGSSSRLSTSSKLGDIEGLEGERFTFNINGKEFTFSRDDTIGTMINKVNTGNAGVTMSYSSIGSIFKLTANATGKEYNIDVTQSEGNLLGTIFRTAGDAPMFEAGNTAASLLLTTGTINGKTLNPVAEFSAGAQFSININGVDHTYRLSSNSQSILFFDNLNSWLKDIGGFELDSLSNEVANIELVWDSDPLNPNGIYLEVRNGAAVKFNQTTVDTANPAALEAGLKTDIALAMGLNNVAKSNIATADTSVDDIYQLQDLLTILRDNFSLMTIPDTVGELGTLNDTYPLLAAGILDNAEIGFSDGRLTLTATTGTALNLADPNTDPTAQIRKALGAILGVDSLTYNADEGGLTSAALLNEGKDAKVIINGVETSRSGNTFEVDGITLQLTSKSPVTGGTGTLSDPFIYDETVINTERDTETIISSFKSFIEDYNAMIDLLNGYLHADPLYREYAPLTDEQKREMTDREIEMWEENAKTGLIRNDLTVSAFLNGLYGTLYNRPISSSYALYDIGIEATDYKQPGKLFLDEDQLRRALQNDPASVEALFTDSVNGLSKQMGNLMDGVARISIANPGSLVSMAGVGNSYTDTTSDINRDINQINDKLKDLWDKYERERARYWKKFNDMETILANYQAQSEWLYQTIMTGFDY